MMSTTSIYDDLRWHNIEENEDDGFEGPYLSVNHAINRKIYLYTGDAWKLPVDAIVIGQNENLTDRSESAQIFSLAGPQFEEAANKQAPVSTGSSILCTGANLCPFIILSACPKYADKFATTAHNSLFFAYKKALLLASAEPSIKVLAFTCLYLRKSKFPRDQGAHVALRTIRRFLEHDISQTFEKLVLCTPSDDFELYKLLMRGYFPRNMEEALSQPELISGDLGDEWGEITSFDRSLNITAGPRPLSVKPLNPELIEKLKRNEKLITGQKELVDVPWPVPMGMSEVAPDADPERIDKISKDMADMTKEERLRLKHQFMIAEAMEEDLSDVAEMSFINVVGRDRLNRHVVLITAANIKVPEEDCIEEGLKDRMILCIIRTMEELKGEDYVLIYACAGFKRETSPDVDWISTVFGLFSSIYASSLKQLYILHATLMMRLYIAFSLPFLSNSFWSNYICVEKLKGLLQYCEVQKLKLPPNVTEYDKSNFPDDYSNFMHSH